MEKVLNGGMWNALIVMFSALYFLWTGIRKEEELSSQSLSEEYKQFAASDDETKSNGVSMFYN